jgi:catechol 2,3-dioxygenase-like lactoylglutathione lyase family enzyme
MNTSTIGHLQINIHTQNLGFYKELFSFLGWQTLYEDENMLGVGDGQHASLWFAAATKDVANDYDGPGLNHLGLSVAKQGDVDQAVTFLKEHGVECLFETPRHRAEFSGPGNTYYQVMFETPDRLLIEVVYTGVKE